MIKWWDAQACEEGTIAIFSIKDNLQQKKKGPYEVSPESLSPQRCTPTSGNSAYFISASDTKSIGLRKLVGESQV